MPKWRRAEVEKCRSGEVETCRSGDMEKASPLSPCLAHWPKRLSFVLERGHAGQGAALQKFKRGAAAGRDMRHLLCRACGFNSSSRIAAANNRRSAARGNLGQCLDDGVRSLCKGRELGHA